MSSRAGELHAHVERASRRLVSMWDLDEHAASDETSVERFQPDGARTHLVFELWRCGHVPEGDLNRRVMVCLECAAESDLRCTLEANRCAGLSSEASQVPMIVRSMGRLMAVPGRVNEESAPGGSFPRRTREHLGRIPAAVQPGRSARASAEARELRLMRSCTDTPEAR